MTLAVLGIGLTALMQLYSASLRTVKKAEDHTIATIQARSLLEEAIASPYPADMNGTFDLAGGLRATRTVSTVFESEQTVEYEFKVRVEFGRGESMELTGNKTVSVPATGSANAP